MRPVRPTHRGPMASPKSTQVQPAWLHVVIAPVVQKRKPFNTGQDWSKLLRPGREGPAPQKSLERVAPASTISVRVLVDQIRETTW